MTPIPSTRRILPSFMSTWLLAVAFMACGCRTLPFRHPEDNRPKTLTAADGLKADSGVVRTDFHSEVNPEHRVGIHLDLARALETQGNTEAAIVEYQKAIEEADRHRGLSPKVPSAEKALAHRRMAAALDRIGRFAQAEAHYREALRESPNDARVWNDAGYSAYLQRRWDEAERKLKTAARLAPEDPRIHTNLGLCLAAEDKTDEALKELSRSGGPAIGHANLAYVLAALGKTDDARRHYQIALRFQPELSAARVALARLDTDASKSPVAVVGTTDPTVSRATSPPSR